MTHSQAAEREALAQAALIIFRAVERHAGAIARDVAQGLDSMWRDPRYTTLDRADITDRATDVDWPAQTDRAEGTGQEVTEPYLAIYREMRKALGLPVEC